MASKPTARYPLVEFRGFRPVDDESREYLFQARGRGGRREYRFRVRLADITAAGLHMQDVPDMCFRLLAEAIATATKRVPNDHVVTPEVLAHYRKDHPPSQSRSFTSLRGEPRPDPRPRKGRASAPPPALEQAPAVLPEAPSLVPALPPER